MNDFLLMLKDKDLLSDLANVLRRLADELENLQDKTEYVYLIHLGDDLYKFCSEKEGEFVYTFSFGGIEDMLRLFNKKFNSKKVSDSIFKLTQSDLNSLEDLR